MRKRHIRDLLTQALECLHPETLIVSKRLDPPDGHISLHYPKQTGVSLPFEDVLLVVNSISDLLSAHYFLDQPRIELDFPSPSDDAVRKTLKLSYFQLTYLPQAIVAVATYRGNLPCYRELIPPPPVPQDN